ncbi:phage baseplate assembly protein V [Shimia haliotis]|uniref:Phage P2 baseplate assembly protein gpV n=1 Tax=Shimia haliotis TaxID=1280847 RepID=A0A1I4C6D9_9RHOB|nr:phage baseplate assembly protein V [Shimia haliotis]SFK76672.1 Phage P2 baseplate assembly protein gpV [Shimia haliotis]
MAIRELVELAARIAELERRFSGMMRHGTVAEVDTEAQRIRLDFGPAHGISGRFLSPWIPYAQFSGALRVHTPPSIGQQFTAMSPNGDFQQAVAVPLTHSSGNPSPSTAADQNVLHFGAVTVTLAEDSLEIAVGGVRFKVDGANVEITGGEVRHNGKNIGDSHIHSGVRSGPSVTGTPAN